MCTSMTTTPNLMQIHRLKGLLMQLFKRIELLLDFSLSVVPITTVGKKGGREGGRSMTAHHYLIRLFNCSVFILIFF